MGVFGSGPRRGSKNTTSDFRALDIRRLQRDGLLIPGRFFNWQWSINGEKIADINIRIEANNVILNYRSRRSGGEWQPIEYPVFWNGRLATLGGSERGFFARGVDADGVWQFFLAVQFSRVGSATSWLISVSGKLMMIGRCVGRKRSGGGLAGNPV